MTPRAMHGCEGGSLTMKHSRFAFLALALTLTGLLMWPLAASGQIMADYTAMPPNAGLTVKPNILLLMDNSASLRNRAACDPSCLAFSSSTAYSGMFDSLTCYTYDTTDTRFEPAATKSPAVLGTACSSTQWDGNFLNWVTFRRLDAVKKAMIGGVCVVGVVGMIVNRCQVPFSSPWDRTLAAFRKNSVA